MSRPLLISDCDEVLLHMVTHFRDWLADAHAIDFALHEEDWRAAMVRRDTGAIVAEPDIWPLLDGFFDTEMPRQTIVPGAIAALERIAEAADVVILTNLRDHRQVTRTAQLEAHGVRLRVVCNTGGKGEAVTRLVDEFRPTAVAFVDDLAVQHASVAQHAPAGVATAHDRRAAGGGAAWTRHPTPTPASTIGRPRPTGFWHASPMDPHRLQLPPRP